MKKIVTIIGARPQIIKSSALSRAVNGVYRDQIKEVIVHTGQHYDDNMSDVFFREMGIPRPDYNLSVGSGSHGSQTAKMMEGLEDIFLKEKPDAVVIYGDTNSTLAGALAAVKIHIPVVHIEAGLRSYNKRMPEEINRITSDHCSTLLFTPTDSGIKNLQKEGFDLSRKGKADLNNPFVYKCGDIMYDNSLYFSTVSEEKSNIINDLGLTSGSYILSTVHRDSNTDQPEKLEAIFNAYLTLLQQDPELFVVLPLHPRTKNKMQENLSASLLEQVADMSRLMIIPPAGFLDIIALEQHAKLIITDSGGLQKEAFFFKKPCIILRPETEWVEIVENGNAIIADADQKRILEAYRQLSLKTDYTYPSFYGDGKAAEFICSCIVNDI
ncbi:MAG: UDP-N-acetylglucosamine 2-epimerase (non-hydrolyzing) [Bacteroidetes bacterium]|nr:MAG: UDP-N-acetylglucosamine 2-epimerase (non-hydrolyzing) [Bacteroidota bacterium]